MDVEVVTIALTRHGFVGPCGLQRNGIDCGLKCHYSQWHNGKLIICNKTREDHAAQR